MSINEIFTFTTSNGKQANAIVIDIVAQYYELSCQVITIYLCYTPNYIFTYKATHYETKGTVEYTFDRICMKDITYPIYDNMLEQYTKNK